MASPVKRKSGRRPGNRGSCSACGEYGHAANRDGTGCSAVAIAERMVRAGTTQEAAAKLLGIKPQAVSQRMKKRADAEQPHRPPAKDVAIEEHW